MVHKRYCLALFSNVAIERGELLLLLLLFGGCRISGGISPPHHAQRLN